MNSQMIVKIKKCLDNLMKKTIKIRQKGFVVNQFFINKMTYKIQEDILNLKDEKENIYLSLNLNQVYQVEISENKIILFMDNDIEIEISI